MNSFLLDTHVWLWLGATPERIRPEVLQLLADPKALLYFSGASSWEISIKYRLGKLSLPEPPSIFIAQRLLRDRINYLPIELNHTTRVADLPDFHSDPFDRLLIAQAQIERIKLVTADSKLSMYELELIQV